MLCYTSGLTGCNLGFSDVVKQRGFTVVNMTHNGNNRCPRFKIFGVILFQLNFVFNNFFGVNEFHFVVIFFSNQLNGRSVQALINGNHHAQRHTGCNNIRWFHIQEICKVTNRDEFCYFQNFIFELFHLLLHGKLFFPLLFSLTAPFLTLASYGTTALHALHCFAHFLFNILFIYARTTLAFLLPGLLGRFFIGCRLFLGLLVFITVQAVFLALAGFSFLTSFSRKFYLAKHFSTGELTGSSTDDRLFIFFVLLFFSIFVFIIVLVLVLILIFILVFFGLILLVILSLVFVLIGLILCIRI